MNPFEGWRITSKYGNRIHPITKVPTKHRGIDLVMYHKYPIPAFVGGRVEVVSGSATSKVGFGLYVIVRDKYNYRHIYAHLDSTRCKVGQILNAGDTVGNQGNSGASTGSHLHYEIRSGGPGTDVEPTQYLINYFKKELVIEVENLRREVNAIKQQIAKKPAAPWQNQIITKAENTGLIDKGVHKANDDVQKWFVVELFSRVDERLKKLEDKIAKL